MSLTGVLLVLFEKLVNLVTDLAVWNFNIILGIAAVGHEGEETVVGDVELHEPGQPQSPRTKYEHGGGLTSWNSRRETLGTSMLWVDGQRSSYFLLVKMSTATKWTLAWPCLPVLEVDMSTILHGRPLMTT